MKKLLLLILLLISTTGCMTTDPYKAQYDELSQAYQSGKLSYAEYKQLQQGVQNQEQAFINQCNQRTMQSLDSFSNNMKKVGPETVCRKIGDAVYCDNY